MTLSIHTGRAFGLALLVLALSLPARADVPPDSGSLLDLSGTVDMSAIRGDAQVEMGKTPSGEPALKVLFVANPAGPLLPNLIFTPPGEGWNLTGYKSIQMDVTNTTSSDLSVRIRVDNPGGGGKNFNVNGLKIPPNSTATVEVPFGSNFGKPADYTLDPAAVSRILLYITKPDADTTILITNFKAVK